MAISVAAVPVTPPRNTSINFAHNTAVLRRFFEGQPVLASTRAKNRKILFEQSFTAHVPLLAD